MPPTVTFADDTQEEHLTSDYITGEGYREPAPMPQAQPKAAAPVQSIETDWELLHLAHVEQVSPAQHIWVQVLKMCETQFVNGLRDLSIQHSRVSLHGGRIRGAHAKQIRLWDTENRWHPQIERAVREATGSVLTIRYVVQARLMQTYDVRGYASAQSQFQREPTSKTD